jgi:hypothetical protein
MISALPSTNIPYSFTHLLLAMVSIVTVISLPFDMMV